MEEDSVLLCDMIRPSSGEGSGGGVEGGGDGRGSGVDCLGGGLDTCGSSGPDFFWGKVYGGRCQHSVEELTSSRRQTRRKTPRSRSERCSRSLQTRIKVIFVFLLLIIFLFSSV